MDSGHDVVAVLTRPDAAVGRKKIMTASPVAMVAHELNLPSIKATSVTPSVIEQLSEHGASLGVVVAYGAILNQAALASLPQGWINLHYSILPDWRGAAPVQNSILHGDRTTGVTLFQLDEGMDTGPILDSVQTEILPGETAGELLARLTELSKTLLSQSLPLIQSGLAVRHPQPTEGLIRPAVKLGRSDALIDWTKSAKSLERQVLALNPEPVAFTFIEDQPIRILDALAISDSEPSTLSPGTLVFESRKVSVVCGDSALLVLREVQPSGKRPMPGLDWSRGVAGKFSKFNGVEF